jgi:hypothetical protein
MWGPTKEHHSFLGWILGLAALLGLLLLLLLHLTRHHSSVFMPACTCMLRQQELPFGKVFTDHMLLVRPSSC